MPQGTETTVRNTIRVVNGSEMIIVNADDLAVWQGRGYDLESTKSALAVVWGTPSSFVKTVFYNCTIANPTGSPTDGDRARLQITNTAPQAVSVSFDTNYDTRGLVVSPVVAAKSTTVFIIEYSSGVQKFLVTEAYESLTQAAGSGGGGVTSGGSSGLSSVPLKPMVFLSAANGNDSSGSISDITKPYQTLSHAISAASAGSVVHVLDGVFGNALPGTENRFGKDQVNLFFEPGTGILVDMGGSGDEGLGGSLGSGSIPCITDTTFSGDGASTGTTPMSVTVDGHGTVELKGNVSAGRGSCAVLLADPGSKFNIHLKSLTNNTNDFQPQTGAAWYQSDGSHVLTLDSLNNGCQPGMIWAGGDHSAVIGAGTSTSLVTTTNTLLPDSGHTGNIGSLLYWGNAPNNYLPNTTPRNGQSNMNMTFTGNVQTALDRVLIWTPSAAATGWSDAPDDTIPNAWDNKVFVASLSGPSFLSNSQCFKFAGPIDGQPNAHTITVNADVFGVVNHTTSSTNFHETNNCAAEFSGGLGGGVFVNSKVIKAGFGSGSTGNGACGLLLSHTSGTADVSFLKGVSLESSTGPLISVTGTGSTVLRRGYFTGNSGQTALTMSAAGSLTLEGVTLDTSAAAGKACVTLSTANDILTVGLGGARLISATGKNALVGSFEVVVNGLLACQNNSGVFGQSVGATVTFKGPGQVNANGLCIYDGGIVTGRLTAQTAAVASVVTATPQMELGVMVSANVLVTTSSAESFTVTVAYTDENSTARTLTLPFTKLDGTSTTSIASSNGAVPYMGTPVRIRAKLGTSITVATTGTFTGATYNVEASIRKA